MIWQDKEIAELSDKELNDASVTLAGMIDNYNSKKLDPRWIKRFKNQPEPQINPSFIQLQKEVAEELERRKVTS